MALEIKGTVDYQGNTYEPTGELRAPLKGEWFMTASGMPSHALTNLVGYYFILREVKPPHQHNVGDWVKLKESLYKLPVGHKLKIDRIDRDCHFWFYGDQVEATGYPRGICLAPSSVEPCEPPQPKYRPFASAEEFKPHRDRWIRNPGKGAIGRVHTYDDHGVNSNESRTYEQLLEFGIVFDDDGTPCGILVTE